MPLVRLITPSSDDALPVVEQLRALGYTVETVAPGQPADERADLEISLERHSAHTVLSRAAELLADNMDIYIGAGAFSSSAGTEIGTIGKTGAAAAHRIPTMADTVNGVARGLQNKRDLLAKALREQRAAMRSARPATQAPQEEEVAHQPEQIVEQVEAPRPIGIEYQELMQMSAEAERQQAVEAEAREALEQQRIAEFAAAQAETERRNAQHQAWLRDRELQRERHEREVERERRERELERQRQDAEERQRTLAASPVVQPAEVNNADVPYPAAAMDAVNLPQQDPAETLLAEPADQLSALPVPVQSSPQQPAAVVSTEAIQTAQSESIQPPPRHIRRRLVVRIPHQRRLSRANEWRIAVAISAVFAGILILAWSRVTRGPASPLPNSVTSSAAEQEVPFGAVTLRPTSAPQVIVRGHRAVAAAPSPAKGSAVRPAKPQAVVKTAKKGGDSKTRAARRRSPSNEIIAADVTRRVGQNAPVESPQSPRKDTKASLKRFSDLK